MFRYKEDRIPVAIFVAYFALDVCVYLTVDAIGLLVLWYLVGIIPKACIAAWNHHHQHVFTFRRPILNRLLEVVYGFHTGVTTHAWVLHHTLGHHRNYLDQAKDESRWRRLDGKVMGALEYSLSVMLTAYPRAYAVGRTRPKLQRTFITWSLITFALLGLAIWHDPVAAILVFALPMATALFLTALATHAHHSGLDTDDEYRASYNVMNPLYNRMTGNLGYHTAHHVKCGVHWSKLPELHAKMAAKIPATHYREPGLPWSVVPTPAPPEEAPAA